MAKAPANRGPEVLPLPQSAPPRALAPAPRAIPAADVGAVPESNALASRMTGRTPPRPALAPEDPFSNAAKIRVVTSTPTSDVAGKQAKGAPAARVSAPEAEVDAGPGKDRPKEAPAGRGVGKGEGPAAKGGARGGAPAREEGAGAVGEAAGGAGPDGGPALLMPEPPSAPSAAARKRLAVVQQSAAKSATAHADLPPADVQSSQARTEVTPPPEETNAQAGAELIAALDKEPGPSPMLEILCAHIYWIILSKRPPSEDDLVKAKPEEMAQAAGGQLTQSIQGDTKRVEGGYKNLEEADPKGKAAKPGQTPEPPPGTVDAAPQNAAAAAPDAVPAENVSLEGDVAANEARMREAGMEKETAKLAREAPGPIADAHAAHGELNEIAERGPAEVLAEQQKSLGQAHMEMAELQKSTLLALQASRKGTIGDNRNQQVDMVGSEETQRKLLGKEARELLTAAQNSVRKTLKSLTTNAMDKWDKGVKTLSTKFKVKLNRVERWIDERHSGVGGTILSVVDWATGLPGWVTDEYDAAEKEFADGVIKLVREISKEVNGIVAACEEIITNANTKIADVFAKAPKGLAEWAKGEQAKFTKQLDDLRTETRQTRDTFNKDLAKRAGQAVHDVRTQIHALRQAAKGAIGRAIEAIAAFLDDPIRAIIDALLSIVGIPSADFWSLVELIKQAISDIADDPSGFANNLFAALKQGFGLFFDNFGEHLLKGLLEWLFSGLKGVGIEIPKDFSLKSVITFFLQLMGISWARIRKLLAKHIGEDNVALIEKAWSIISTLIEEGPEGIFELIKDKLDPQAILDMILKVAKDYLIEALIKQAMITILSLFNPVGAIYQALKLIYKVLKWIINNAERIFRLVETIVKGIADIIAGNIGGMAKAIEKALAGLIVTVIDFIADYLGIGDLPDKVKETIETFQGWIEGILDKVIGWLVNQAKALLKAVGLGKEDKKEGGKYDGEIGKVVTFNAAGESHRLRIVMQGNDAVVMMASEEKPLQEHLDNYQVLADKLEDEKKKAKAIGLISQARQMLSQVDKQADHAVETAANAEAKPEQINAEDEAVEHSETSLGAVLKEIHILLVGELETNLEMTREFSIAGESHTLFVKVENGVPEIAMASDRRIILSLSLPYVLQELNANMMMKRGRRKKCRGIIDRAIRLVDSKDIREDFNNLQKGEYKAARTLTDYFNIRLNEIINDLIQFSGEGISGLEDLKRKLLVGNGPYSYLVAQDPADIQAGKEFESWQRDLILEHNSKKNGGLIRSDKSPYTVLNDALPAEHDNKPNIDHMISRFDGGSNSFSNARVLSRKENLEKGAASEEY